jgi:multidrug efflux pump subunit AcrB
MLVDNSIVVLENIFRRRAEGEDAIEAAGAGADASAFGAAAFFAGAVVAGAFFAGAFLATFFGTSGCWGRIRPSSLARLRTRSACASSKPEEWLFTP